MKETTGLIKQLGWLLEGVAAWWLYGLFRLLPIRWCSALGAKLGRVHGAEKRHISSRVRECLSWLMPSIDSADQSKLTGSILQNTGRSYFETMVVDRLVSADLVDTDLPSHINAHLSKGTPLILVTVHLANLGDLMSATLSNLLFRDYKYHYGASPTRPIANSLLQSLSAHIRNRYLHGTSGHSSSPDFRTARDYSRALKKSHSFVIFHLDEAYDRQVHFPAFGRPIDPRGNLIKTIKLAAATGAMIQPLFMTRLSNEPRFKVSWLPGIQVENDGAPLSKVNLLRYAQQLNELFEPQVFENLADWTQVCYLRSPTINELN